MRRRYLYPALSGFFAAFLIGAVATFAQQDKPTVPPAEQVAPVADTSKEIVKVFPPPQNAKFTEAQTEVALAQARLETAQAKLRLMLYAIADEMQLTIEEKNTCPYGQNANGNWIFRCPPKDTTAKKTDKPPGKAVAKQ